METEAGQENPGPDDTVLKDVQETVALSNKEYISYSYREQGKMHTVFKFSDHNYRTNFLDKIYISSTCINQEAGLFGVYNSCIRKSVQCILICRIKQSLKLLLSNIGLVT